MRTPDLREPRELDYDLVNEGSDLSFPASDPPAWMGGAAIAAPTARTIRETTAGFRVAPRSRRRVGPALAVAIGGGLVLVGLAIRRHSSRG